ncbi:hypothetical protein AWZ03_000532 [Drosophila navojoa]|uniref:Uncharacterized protein n=1 Tax=Drosophila navojoa TaxID=7232 RepID=A0A484BVY2_DRONA|nr:hypothetical protein AWZ03_000532 [Drosophila navojoa]
MLEKLIHWYRNFCIYLPMWGAALAIFVGQVQRRVYRLTRWWDHILEMYTCACLLVLLLVLLWYYMVEAYRILANKRRNGLLFTDVLRFLFNEGYEHDDGRYKVN